MTPNLEATLKRFDEISASIEAQKATKQSETRYQGNGDGRRVDVPRYCANHNIEIVAIKDAPGGGTMYCLKNCLFDQNHGPNEASIIQQPSGQLSYQCFHETCKGFRWHEARQAISGDARLNPWMIGDNGHTGETAKVQVTSANRDIEDGDNEPYDIFGETLFTGKPEWPDGACPEVFEAFARDEAERIGVDTPMVAIPAIVCAAVAISDAFQIQPKEHDYTWRESPRLWAAIVADPGQKKTPALNAAFAPLREIEREFWLTHKEDLAAYARKMKPIRETAKKRDGAACEAEAEPKKPVHLRRLVDDITIEALRKILAVNPGGVGCVKDELSSWIRSFDMYREKQRGKDRADYCELYQGGSKLFDRVQEGFCYVPNWGASIVGGIQPGVIGRTLGKITEDGLLARFLVVFAGRNGRGEDRPPDRRALGNYQETIRALCRLEPKGEREVCRLSPGAAECRATVVDIIEAMQVLPDTSDALKGHLNKFESAFCRLALVFHITEAVARGERPAETVSEETAQMAGRLLLDFLFPNSMRFYRELVDIGGPHNAVQKVAGYILAGGVEVLTRRELLQNFRKLDPVSFQACIRALEAANWMDPAKIKKDGTVTSWAIKPAVHLVFAERAKVEKVRREAEKVKIAGAVRLLRPQRAGKNEPI